MPASENSFPAVRPNLSSNRTALLQIGTLAAAMACGLDPAAAQSAAAAATAGGMRLRELYHGR